MSVITSPWPAVELPECSVWEKVWSIPKGRKDTDAAVIDGLTGRVLSRADLRTLSQRLAHGFQHTARLSPGDVVLLFSPNSFYYHAIVLATQCAGVVFSGANAAYESKELQHQLEDSGAKLLLVHPSILDVALAATSALGWTAQDQKDRLVLAVRDDEAGPAANEYRTLDYIISEELLEPHKVEKPRETVAYLGYSSGTSGKAKGVRTSVYNMTSVLSILAPLKLYDNDVVVAQLPLNHIYGLTKLLHWPVLHGAPVVVAPPFKLPILCDLVQKYKISVLMLVPPIALALARSPEIDKYDLSSLRLVISGAAPLGPELEKELAARLPGCEVRQAYGLTETSPTTHVCIGEAPGSIGPLLPMMKARIVDPETGKDAEKGKTGEMWLAGPNVMLGYLNRPSADAETLVETPDGERWLRTGDIAYVDEKDNFFIADRLKELIKVKGFQVPPAELEATLLECPYIADCAVIGVWDDNEATEYPRAYIVLCAEGKKQKDPAVAIHSWTAGKVAKYKQLRGGIKLVEVIPKSPSGKILRRILRDEAQKEQDTARAKKEAKAPAARL
ncbi:hypothetical protein JCM8097_002547 [Rhodosporidiobolus ruineniae]